tara:strand:+ start:688 stop:1431 length:744 start_codon:yes stop_codon:yes gene_type:complete
MEFTKKEIKHLLIAAIIAGFVFSFNEWGIEAFNLKLGLQNLLRATLISAFIYSIHTLSQKIMASKSDCEIEFNLISTKMKFLPRLLHQNKFAYPIGPIATILVSIIANGKLFFIALASFDSKIKRKKRVGHQWVNIKETEEATVAFMGPLSNLILLTVSKLLLSFSPAFFTKAMFITSSLAIFHLLPFPKFDGLKIFMGNKILYMFAIVLAVVLIFLVNFTTAFKSILLSVIIASFVAVLYTYKLPK